MRCLTGMCLVVLIIGAGGFAFAQNLGNQRAEKSDLHVLSNPVSDDRDGGETIADAVVFTDIPFADAGATCDNADDYDEACPYSGSTSPDVVYAYTPIGDILLTVDLCGSLYDTKTYVYDADLNLVACNDDYYFDEYCGVYVSYIDYVDLSYGQTYYFVVDGYGGDCGEYNLEINHGPIICTVECPPGSQMENEPTLEDGYVDSWNGGCNSEPSVFQWIECRYFCGIAGWFMFDGSNNRDTDWLECTAAGELITWTADADSETNCFQLSIPDCGSVEVLQSMTVGPLWPHTMTIDTAPGEIVHLWVGSSDYSNPGGIVGNEYLYVCDIEGIVETSNTEQVTWSSVKSLFR